MRTPSVFAALACALLSLNGPMVRAQIPAKYKPTIQKGLDWLARSQNPRTGHWEGTNGQYPVSMTGLAGMALLSEGSTTRAGKYSKNIRRARDWLMAQAQANGLISNPREQGQGVRYMYGHGFGLLFLSCVYGEEQDQDKRRKLEDILTRACQFTRDAQTSRGGWGYVSAKDSNQFDEGSVTITQLQALRAARNAGIKVPADTIKDAVKYLTDSTGSDGGVRYSLAQGGGGPGKPALTAAAICCGFSAGEYDSPLVKKWLGFCQQHIPTLGVGARIGHDEYTHYYYAQAVYALGEDGWVKLFPDAKAADRVTWRKYREAAFDGLVRTQQTDGSWSGHNWTASFGQVYVTAVFLTILQLDNNTLPIYQK
ncbi:MAG: terpene cyclase/mutase family protein [Planctomycetes bacterium]|nr:terpene cyclase/mutase family protein [Planctomycetota bacterium]